MFLETTFLQVLGEVQDPGVQLGNERFWNGATGLGQEQTGFQHFDGIGSHGGRVELSPKLKP